MKASSEWKPAWAAAIAAALVQLYNLSDTVANSATKLFLVLSNECKDACKDAPGQQAAALQHTCMKVTIPSRPLICANTCLQDTILQAPDRARAQGQQQQGIMLGEDTSPLPFPEALHQNVC